MFGPTFDHVKTEKTMIHKVYDAIGLVFMFAAVLLLITNWGKLPDTVPIHFNIKGEADGWGSKYSLIILPILTISFFAFLSYYEKKPHHFNYAVKLTEKNVQKQFEMARTTMNMTKNGAVVLLSFMAISTVFDARETPIPYSNVVIFSLIGLLIGLAIVTLIRSIKHK